jgi:hypothetical protein
MTLNCTLGVGYSAIPNRFGLTNNRKTFPPPRSTHKTIPLYTIMKHFISNRAGFGFLKRKSEEALVELTFSDLTSNLVRQYDFPFLLPCRKTPDTVFVAFVHPLSEPVRSFFSCSTDFSQQIAQVVLFLYLHGFLF